MANLYVYLLPAILHAVYACVPLTPPRPRPTPKPPGATGEVPATTTTTETTTTTVEACSGTPDNSTVTEDGNRCVFPFKDGDILHTSCVDYKGKYDWCATSLKSDCSFDTWSKCLETTSKPEEKCLTEEVNSGKECLFPFMFEGKEHLECLPYKGKFWCGLTYEYDKQRWGYCTQALCPPTKVEATEVPVTTQGPTEVPATSPEPETTTTTTTATATEVTTPLDWEGAQTTVDIAVDGSFYSCNIDFKMTTDKGVKYKDVTSSCSGSSKTDDMIDKLGVHRFTLTMQSGIGISCQVGAALMPQSLTLSVEVMENTLKCEPLDSQCITIGGNNFPDNCVFPYNYQGRHYKACTDSSKDPSKLWCPTAVSASGEAEKDSWGFCSPSCAYCGGSPIARGAPDSQPCGFDCVLNPAKKKAGLEQATMSFNSPIQDKAGVVGGNYKFNFGSQTITISCHEKFYDPALRGEKMVIARCGPEQHRYTVKNKGGDILGTEIKKDSFGCDPCPASYSFLPGFMSSKEFTSSGVFYDVASVKDCKTICEDSCACQTFEYSEQHSSCRLVKELVSKAPFSTQIDDYAICTKDENSDPCGTNTALDPSHLLAETNWPYLSQYLNQTGHPNKVYKTKVFQLVSVSSDGTAKVVMSPTDCPVDNPGLVSLFLAPVTAQCNEKTLGDSSGQDLHHVMIDTSCDLDATINKFIAEKDMFKTAYHLCAARTRQERAVAVSRKQTLLDIFSFLYNTQATAVSFDPDKERVCKTKEETVKTIQTMFDTSDNVQFLNAKKACTEEEGFLEVTLIRPQSAKISATFVQTTFKSIENSKAANINDIVPYSGLVTFPPNMNSASLFITIIRDQVNEPDEFFQVELMGAKKGRDGGLCSSSSCISTKIHGGAPPTTAVCNGELPGRPAMACQLGQTTAGHDILYQGSDGTLRQATTCSSYELDGNPSSKPWCYTNLSPPRTHGFCTPTCKGVMKSNMVHVASKNKKDNCYCGYRNDKTSRVFNGKNAKIGEFPWQVALIKGSGAGGVLAQFCGGAVVGKHHVITAAHCVHKKTGVHTNGFDIYTLMATREFDVLIGATNLVVREEGVNTQQHIVQVAKIRPHPKFEQKTITTPATPTTPGSTTLRNLRNDMAVLVLVDKLVLKTFPNIKPVCLPFGKNPIKKNTEVTVSGWGKITQPDTFPSDLQYAKVKVLGKTVADGCVGGFSVIDSFCTEGTISSQGRTAHCAGDSGGPVVIQEGSGSGTNKHYTLIGINSMAGGPPGGPPPPVIVGECTEYYVGYMADVYYQMTHKADGTLDGTDGWLKTALNDATTCGGKFVIP